MTTKEKGIIEVKRRDMADPDRLEHCGMAILIAPRIALTCAHVVNAAMDRRLDHPQRPGPNVRILLTFPLVPGGSPVEAGIVRWTNVGIGLFDDLALLELDEPAPQGCGTTILANLPASAVDAGPWSVFGVSAGGGVGHHVDLKLQGNATAAWRQINAAGSMTIEPGFSGAGVWDDGHQATIGMAVRHAASTRAVAYFIPTAALVQFAGNIPYECRTLSSIYARAFTVFAALFFIAALFHMLGDRIGQFPAFLTLGLGNDILSAFWGLHVVAIGLPVLLTMLLRFARSFREHLWWMRVPQFGFLGAPARPATSRLAAALTLVVLVAMPLYMHGHFLRRLHDPDTRVYINADIFGFKPEALRECGPGPGGGYCVHPEAGRYRLAEPVSGAPGGYVDNAYHIGAHDRAKTRDVPGSVTFFPILQPVVLIGLFALSLFLAARLLWRIVRRARRTIDADAPADPKPLKDSDVTAYSKA